MCENHLIFAPSVFRNCFHTPNNMKSEMHKFNLLPRWLAFLVGPIESFIQALTGKKWIMGFEIRETEILLLEYVPTCQMNDWKSV